MIQNLPTIQRNVSSLLDLQPAVTPMTTSDVMGGQVAGAASDQTTFMVDGGDATSDIEGTNSYASVPGEVEPSPIVQVGVESTSEFRVVSAGPTSNENRSQGGQISIVSKRGTNSFHGSGYEYYQGAVLNANSWENNRDGISRPGLVNNRFGATFGGPFMRNKFWFFGNYEGRRFRQTADVTTDVPTASAIAGNLIFPNSAGTLNTYNLKTSTACGTAGTTLCDPRGIGIDPLIQKYWGLEPSPNTPGTGDIYNSEVSPMPSRRPTTKTTASFAWTTKSTIAGPSSPPIASRNSITSRPRRANSTSFPDRPLLSVLNLCYHASRPSALPAQLAPASRMKFTETTSSTSGDTTGPPLRIHQGLQVWAAFSKSPGRPTG